MSFFENTPNCRYGKNFLFLKETCSVYWILGLLLFSYSSFGLNPGLEVERIEVNGIAEDVFIFFPLDSKSKGVPDADLGAEALL